LTATLDRVFLLVPLTRRVERTSLDDVSVQRHLGKQLSRTDIAPVLEADPELGEGLEPQEFDAAQRTLLARVITLEPGRWRPEDMWTHADHPTLGILVLDGLATREVTVAGRHSTELLGSGDLLRPWDQDGDVGMLQMPATWTITARMRVAVLDERFLVAACRWPSIVDQLSTRMIRRSRYLSFRLAMKEIMRVEGRLLILFWALSERWGHVTPRGVHVRLRLTHEALGKLVGARRPSVTTAIGALTAAGEIERAADGYVLLGDPANALRRAAGDDDDDDALAS
jgi:CRP/FNR family cyclic AMP-dependent transcriptional regulator